MKKIIIRVVGVLLLTIGLTLFTTSQAQNGDPPPPPSQHGETGNLPAGGGAPIDGGMVILALLGAGYSARKWHNIHKKVIA